MLLSGLHMDGVEGLDVCNFTSVSDNSIKQLMLYEYDCREHKPGVWNISLIVYVFDFSYLIELHM